METPQEAAILTHLLIWNNQTEGIYLRTKKRKCEAEILPHIFLAKDIEQANQTCQYYTKEEKPLEAEPIITE